MLYWPAYFITKFFSRIFFDIRFVGAENIPKTGAFIIASNHISNLDPFLIGLCARRQFSFVAKDSLFKTKFLAFVFRSLGAFPIRREMADFRAIRETLRRLKDGHPVILFPEGTRIQAKKIKRVQPGVGLIAIKSDVPVIPVCIKGSDKVLPPGAKWINRHPIVVTLGAPLRFPQRESYPEVVANQIMDKILNLSTAS